LFSDEIDCSRQAPEVLSVAEALGHNGQLIDPNAFEREPPLDDEDEALFLGYLWEAYNQHSTSGMLALIQREPVILLTQKQIEAGGAPIIDPCLMYEAYSRLPDWPPPLHQYNQIRQEREREAELAILSSPPLDVGAIWKQATSRAPSATQ
jgi:hypothetical protein